MPVADGVLTVVRTSVVRLLPRPSLPPGPVVDRSRGRSHGAPSTAPPPAIKSFLSIHSHHHYFCRLDRLPSCSFLHPPSDSSSHTSFYWLPILKFVFPRPHSRVHLSKVTFKSRVVFSPSQSAYSHHPTPTEQYLSLSRFAAYAALAHTLHPSIHIWRTMVLLRPPPSIHTDDTHGPFIKPALRAFRPI
jgi:hypothetical protein